MTMTIIPTRTIIRITGEDKHSFLQGLITQNIDQLSSEHAIFTALLTPQGKILFDFFIVEDGDAFLIDCDRDATSALVKRLMLYKLRAKVAVDIDDTLAVVASQAQPTTAGPDSLAFPDPRLPALGWRVIAPKGENISDDDYDARRISLGIPEFGKDFGPDEMFLLDVNYDMLNGVSYSKGCFVGQEVTSRMKRKSEVRKRTLIADFTDQETETAPAKGTPVTAGDSRLGEILSGADGQALALIRLDRWEKSKTLGHTATCEGREVRLAIPDYLE
jgi:tRNA-modifying protein YgfZ